MESKKVEPTKSEIKILSILWKSGASSVRFVNDKLNEERVVKYTTTLKLMQIMKEKGILYRDESNIKHLYHVVEDQEKTKTFLLETFLSKIFDGSIENLVMQLVGNKKTSKEELLKIKNILDKMN
jgi:predicted transcriptional regulator